MSGSLVGRRAWPLLAALVISSVGDEITLITLTFRTAADAAWAVPLLLIAELVPALIAAPFAGRMVDRGDPARLLLAVLIGEAAVVALLATTTSIMVTLLGASALGVLFSISGTAIFALIPVVARASGLTLARANALLEVVRSSGMLIGPVIGGLLVAWGGTRAALIVDAATFLLLAVALAASGLRGLTPLAASAEPASRSGILADYRPLLRDRRLAALMGVLGVEVTASAIADIAFVFLVTVTLAAGAPMLGLLTACWAAGMLAGATVAGGVREDRSVVTAFAAAGSMGATMLAIGVSSFTGMAGLAVVGAAFAAGGAANSVHNASVRTVLQTAAPAGAMGRTAALYVGTTQAATVIGYLLGGMFVPDDAPTAYRVSGIAAIVAAAAGWRLFRRKRPLNR